MNTKTPSPLALIKTKVSKNEKPTEEAKLALKEKIMALINNDTNNDAPYSGEYQPLLFQALMRKLEDIAVALIEQQKVDVCAINGDYCDDSPLHIAAERGLCRAIEALVKAGVDVNGKPGWGETAMHRAATAGQKDAVVALLNAGADINDRCYGIVAKIGISHQLLECQGVIS